MWKVTKHLAITFAVIMASTIFLTACEPKVRKSYTFQAQENPTLTSPLNGKQLIFKIPKCHYLTSSGTPENVTSVRYVFPAGFFNPQYVARQYDCASLQTSKASSVTFTPLNEFATHELKGNDYLKRMFVRIQHKVFVGEVGNYQVYQSSPVALMIVYKNVPAGVAPTSFSFIPAQKPDDKYGGFATIIEAETLLTDDFVMNYSLRSDLMSIYIPKHGRGPVDELMNIYLNGENILQHPQLIDQLFQNNTEILEFIREDITTN